jgi:hypothetical protein
MTIREPAHGAQRGSHPVRVLQQPVSARVIIALAARRRRVQTADL